jgi:hypothetical protein
MTCRLTSLLDRGITVSGLFGGSFECIRGRHTERLGFAVCKRHFQQQADRFTAGGRRHDHFDGITELDHVRPPSDALHHVDAGSFQGVVLQRPWHL